MDRRKERDSPPADLTDVGGKLRLFVEMRLSAGAKVSPRESQAHYLLHVMRVHEGDSVILFNGMDGEWRASVTGTTRRTCTLFCEARVKTQEDVPDLWLAFAPIKKTPADYVVQKATELGVRVLQPVITRRTVARRVNLNRLRANAIEAAEQSGRLSVPEVREAVALDALLRAWPSTRRLIFCDEGGGAAPIADALTNARENLPSAWGVLTGPEGGFDPEERARIRQLSFVLPVSLGPRIMRADTAALAALAVWQALAGDWHLSGL